MPIPLTYQTAEGGSVRNVVVTQSSGLNRLDEAVLSCASHWRFAIASQHGKPVELDRSAGVLFQFIELQIRLHVRWLFDQRQIEEADRNSSQYDFILDPSLVVGVEAKVRGDVWSEIAIFPSQPIPSCQLGSCVRFGP